jgi:general secretion pathway protein D
MKNRLFTKHILLLLVLSFPTLSAYATTDLDNNITEIEFADTTLIDVVRTLSELSDSNIIATPDATVKRVTIRLKNVTVVDAIKSISRIANLWYRYDEDTNTYRIMTREEYSRDLIVRDSEHIEVFNLLNANVRIVAQAIKDLYGSRVVLSMGTEAGQSGTSGGTRGGATSNSNRGSVRNTRTTNNSNRRSNSNNSATGAGVSASGIQLARSDLSVDQLERLSTTLTGQAVNTETLQQVTINAQPIYITVNNEHGMILVRTDDRKVIASIDALIKKMDLPIPQVMLEMKILNITLGDDFNSIFNFELQPSGNNQSLQPIKIGNNALLNSGSFIYEFLNTRLRANIEFLQQNKRIKVLSNPMVLASNHREAELFIGEESLLTRGFTFNPATIGTNGVILSPSYVETQTELQEIGITLRITPRINADGTVTLELEQENSTLNPGGATLPLSDGTGNVINLPIDTINTSRLTGTVVARDSLTVAIGGLIRTSKTNNEKKVPILGEIPILGGIFRSTVESEQDTEMVLLITPRILNKAEDSEKIRHGDNQFYQSHNSNYPDLPALPNKFINKAQPVTNNKMNRQQTYLEMSQYAADTVRIPDIERILDKNYLPIKINRQAINLFSDKRIKAMPVASWNRGGMHVTAIELTNTSHAELPIDYQHVNGNWLASSTESSLLQANNSTYLYLISALPFRETIAGIN